MTYITKANVGVPRYASPLDKGKEQRKFVSESRQKQGSRAHVVARIASIWPLV
jgi:hypothetical protein